MKQTLFNQIVTWFSVLATIVIISSCEKEFDQKEAYKKMVYLVHSEDIIHTFSHPFQENPSKGFVTVYCSGSTLPDKDIEIEMEIDDEIIAKYNYIEFENDTSSFVKMLNQEVFDIPSLRVTILKGELYSNMPILVDAKGLSPDTIYVIPLKIKQVNEYEINEDLSSILYAIKLENSYSGKYRMTGTITDTIGGMEQQVFKEKNIVPINEFTSRMFFAAENEIEANISSNTLTFTVKSDNSVIINDENGVIDLGGSRYYPEKKTFILNYSYEIEEERFIIAEKLTQLDK